MKKIYVLTALLFFSISVVFAQEEEDKFGMDVSLNTDAFFGFAPAAFGSYSLSEKVDFTFYGIFWSGGTADYRTGAINPSQGGGASWGQWTEFGLGLNFAAGNFDINPAIGLLGGNLLSGFGEAQFPDGIVPNLTVNYSSDALEGNFYYGYYAGLSEGQLPGGAGDVASTFNYVHYWASLGYVASDFFSFGLRWEHLYFAGGSNIDESSQYYQSFGPYVTFSDPNGGSYLSFNFGGNLADEEERVFEPGEFWKLTVGYSF